MPSEIYAIYVNVMYNYTIINERVYCMNLALKEVITQVAKEKKESPTVILRESVGKDKLLYRLLKSSIIVEDVKSFTYGIEIECSLFGEKETSRVQDVTTNYEKARDIFEIISTNLVTPVSLKDIVEDFLEE